MHCYRAALESLLRARERKLGLAPREYAVRTIKHADRMAFSQYLKAASDRLEMPDLNDPEMQGEVDVMLGRWMQCSTFYVLRLCMAPVFESFLLLDRVCFLEESGCCEVGVHAAFDPSLSPRNLVITARKPNSSTLQ